MTILSYPCKINTFYSPCGVHYRLDTNNDAANIKASSNSQKSAPFAILGDGL